LHNLYKKYLITTYSINLMNTDHIFSLVKSLDKHEKRFFKRYMKLHNSNKMPQYAYLFNILEKMKQFDKTLMVNELSKVLPGTNVSQLKQYLKNNILSALKIYNKNSSYQLKENEDLNSAKILISKKLYKMAEKLLLKLKRNAEEREHFHLYIQINEMLINMERMKDEQSIVTTQLFETYIEECILYAEKMKEKMAISSLLTKQAKLYNSKQKLSENFNSELIKIVEKDLAPFKLDNLLSNKAKYVYVNLKCEIYGVLNKNTLFLKAIEKLKQLVKIPFFKHYPECIARTDMLILQSYINNHNVEPFYPQLQETQTLINEYPELKSTCQFWIYLRELDFLAYVVKEKPDKKIVQKILRFVSNKNDCSLSEKNDLLSVLARCYFLKQDYKECRNILFDITLKQKISIDEFYFLEIYLMEILCFYELESYKLANSKWINLKRKLVKKGVDNQKLITLIKKIGKAIKQKKEHIAAFEELGNSLKLYAENLSNETNLYFLSVWVEQKMDFMKAKN